MSYGPMIQGPLFKKKKKKEEEKEEYLKYFKESFE
jgi:hypothetical protein